MIREIVLRVRVDDPTDEMLSAAAKYNNVPKAQMALDFLISGLEQYMGALPKKYWGEVGSGCPAPSGVGRAGSGPMADIGIDMNRLTREQREALQQIADDYGETLEQAANRVIGRETKRRYFIPALRRTVTPFRRPK